MTDRTGPVGLEEAIEKAKKLKRKKGLPGLVKSIAHWPHGPPAIAMPATAAGDILYRCPGLPGTRGIPGGRT